MRLRICLTTIFTFCFSATVFGQHAKLEGRVFDDKDKPVSSVKIMAPGGQAAVTDNKGHFNIAFPAGSQPGQPARIEVVRLNWVIYQPMFGNCVTQSSANNYEPLKVIIVPKGSPLSLTPKRLRQVISNWADERAKLHRQVDKLSSQLDEYAFLKEYSERYGFTLDQVINAAEQWAHSKESDDQEGHALKEYFLKNYDRAAQLAHESALAADEELGRTTKKKIDDSLKVIRRFQLEGNSFYEQNKFREALTAYKEIENRFLSRKLLKEDLVREWAVVKVLLGNARVRLGERVAGEESNLFVAEAAKDYEAALTVFTRDADPIGWAVMQHDLANLLALRGQRTHGEEGIRLLTLAVEGYRNALKIYVRDGFSQQWADTEDNLGLALSSLGERVNGEEGARFLAQAAEALRKALEVRSINAAPQSWADTEENLSLVLIDQGLRASGAEGVSLLAEAVEGLKGVLAIRGREGLTMAWAKTQGNLGLALSSQGDRVIGEERLRLLAAAAEAHRQSLNLYTHETVPQQWATAKGRLAGALTSLGSLLDDEKGMPKLTEAIDAYHAALTVQTIEAFPLDWAGAQTNLGYALTLKGLRTSAEGGSSLLSQAVEAHQQALRVFTFEGSPQDWSAVQNNLGFALTVYGSRSNGEESVRLLTQAVKAFQLALTVRTREVLPLNWVQTHTNLAEALVLLKDWPNAAKSFANVLTLYPKSEASFQRAVFINHELLFNYAEAFRLTQQWLDNNTLPMRELLSVQVNFAENHFTTARFDECEKRIAALLSRPELEDSARIPLYVIEIANLCALGKRNLVPDKMDSLVTIVAAQAPNFKPQWAFEGTKHFIGQNETLLPDRPWLGQLFVALESKDHNTMLKALQELRTELKK
jgi:tetratricopeptide (TPR) repeat protein